MRQRIVGKSLLFRGCSALVLLIAVRSSQGVIYHIVNLGALTWWPNNRSEAFDVNDSGTVIGNVSFGAANPFMWTPSGGMKPMGPLFRTRMDCIPISINNLGQATGTLPIPYSRRAFLFQQGHGFKSIGIIQTPGYSEGSRINEKGEIAGTSYHDNGITLDPQAFFWSLSAGMVAVPPLSPNMSTYGQGVNENETVVGFGSFPVGNTTYFRAIRWTANGGTQNLGLLPGCTDSYAVAVNSSETVAGFCLRADSAREAFLWTPLGGMVTLGFSGAPYDMNESGEIVGSAFGKAFTYKGETGLVYLNDHLDASSQGWNLDVANGVNNLGWIVGRGDIDGRTKAFLAIPQ